MWRLRLRTVDRAVSSSLWRLFANIIGQFRKDAEIERHEGVKSFV